jgi:hypothetical protein
MNTVRPILAVLCLVATHVLAASDVAPRSGRGGERVIVIGDDVERASRIEASLRARGLVPLEPSEREGLDDSPARRVGDRERVRLLLLSARSAWRRLDLDSAAAFVDDALAEAFALERPEDHVSDLVDALLFRATVHLNRETPKGVAGDLMLASRLEPGRETLDAALHPPSLLDAWTRARRASLVADTRIVVVRPRVLSDVEADAELIVDGERVVAANGVVELRGGLHMITIRAPGCRSITRVVDVDGTGYAIEDVLVADAVVDTRRSALASLRAGDRAALTQLRMALEVDVIAAIDSAGILVARRGLDVTRLDVDVAASSTTVADAIVTATIPPDADDPMINPSSSTTLGWILGSAGVVVVVGTATLGAWLLWPGEVPPPPPRPVTVSCCGL